MASPREITLSNEITFRNEMLGESAARMANAVKILEQIRQDGSVDIGVESMCILAINILNGHED